METRDSDRFFLEDFCSWLSDYDFRIVGKKFYVQDESGRWVNAVSTYLSEETDYRGLY